MSDFPLDWFERNAAGVVCLKHEKALEAILGFLIQSDDKLSAIDKRVDLSLVEKTVCGSEVAAPTMVTVRRVVHLALGLPPLPTPPAHMVFPTGPATAKPINQSRYRN